MTPQRRFSRAAAGAALLLVAACDAGRPAASDPTAAASSAPNGDAPPPKPTGLRHETLLEKSPNLPPTPVQLLPWPDGSAFFVLGRDGDLFHYDRPLEAFPVSGESWSSARVSRFDGKIRRVKIDGSFAWGDMGTIGMALDPKFLENRRFYVWYADKPDKNVALDRFEWRDRTSETAGTRVNVITFSRREPPAPYHMGGVVKFLPDGTLLIGAGDAERPELSQDRKDLNGKLLRIRPKDEGGYEVPTDNPHVGDAAWRPEIVAHGLRAPFRAHLRDGRHLYFGDVGAVYEEIDLWKGGAVDFGWGHGVISDGPTQPEGTVKPLVSWSQNRDFAAEDPDYNGETRLSAGVGPIYEGFSQDRYDGFLTGKLIFFDVMRGWIRAADLDAEGNVAGHRHVGHRQFISDMILGRDGYLYGVTWCRTESIFRLRLSHEIKPGPKAPPPTPIDEPPRPEGAAGAK